MKRTRNLKLPNGFGSPVYLGGNRRKPYGARITTGWDNNRKQKYKYVGYGETWQQAYDILANYNKNPYNLENKDITLEEVWELLEPKLKDDYMNEVISYDSYSRYVSTWNCHLSKLSSRPVLEIRKKEVKDIIEHANLKYTGRNYIKLLFTKIINYCIDELELKLDSELYKIDLGEKEKSTKHFPFTTEEIYTIRDLAKTNNTAKMLMIYFFTGLRPSELLLIEKSNVFENYMIGGIKTTAGKDRIIPLHPEIRPYVQYFMQTKGKYLIGNLDGSKMTYDTYKKKFDQLMEELQMNHTPHDTRHTFATKCDAIHMPEPTLKILMGHSLAGDVTNDIYVHKTVDRLLEEIERISY